MKINSKQQDPLQLDRENIKETDHFTYLGSVINKEGGADDNIKSHVNKARHTFHTLRPIWKSSLLSLQHRIRIINTNVKAVLLYGSKTWRVTNTNSNKLQVFIITGVYATP
jgi:hypothetical protein